MIFSSITFILYFLPICILGYFLFSFSRVLQNMWLLIASLLFYAWGEPVFVFVLMASIVVNWIMGLLIEKYAEKARLKKTLLVIDCVANIGLLVAFKYTNFIVDNINSLIGGENELISIPTIALPIGISFFTFQALSYVIDVYRADVKAQKNLFYLGLYISFFPQLIAGPIVRYNSIADQILNRKTTLPQFRDGICRFTGGFIKKILISNNMAVVADTIYDLVLTGGDIKTVPAMLAWVGAIAYPLQLYYDFSAYSDMAIGLGKMFGFEFEENFNYPFIAKSAREYMNRWHISLSKWFAQYVYFPLGGSRVENDNIAFRNLFIVWLLTGVWHGAAWNYIWWGMFDFAFITLEKVTGFEKWNIPNWIKHVYTLFVMMISWVFFRASTMTVLGEYLLDMFGLNGNGFYSAQAVMILKEYGIVFAAGIILSVPLKEYAGKVALFQKRGIKLAGGVGYIAGAGLLAWLCIVVLAKGGYNPFIYFNF